MKYTKFHQQVYTQKHAEIKKILKREQSCSKIELFFYLVRCHGRSPEAEAVLGSSAASLHLKPQSNPLPCLHSLV